MGSPRAPSRRYRHLVTATRQAVSVALADDHAVVRSGLRMLLESEPDLAVVAEVGELDELTAMIGDSPPDVLLLDVHMRGGSSLELIPELAARTRVLVLTMQDDPGYARSAMRAGARGYVLKEAEEVGSPPGGADGGGRRHLPGPGARRTAARGAGGHAGERAHRPRARGAEADRAGAHQRRHGRAALPERAHRRDASGEHPSQARHGQSRVARAARPRAGLVRP